MTGYQKPKSNMIMTRDGKKSYLEEITTREDLVVQSLADFQITDIMAKMNIEKERLMVKDMKLLESELMK